MSKPEVYASCYVLTPRADERDEEWAWEAVRRKVADALVDRLSDGNYYTIRLVKGRTRAEPGMPYWEGDTIRLKAEIQRVEMLQQKMIEPPPFKDMALLDLSWTAGQELKKRIVRALPKWMRP